jgi:endonuclease/exonuclease/phosphatase family metal-dependent hydrolase
MKIVTLNAWGGKLNQQLLDFFKKYSGEVDVFLLQEVFDRGHTTFKDANMNLFNDINHVLADFSGYYHSTQTNEEGLAIFIKKNLVVLDCGDIFVHRWKDAIENNDAKTIGRNLQYISIVHDQKKYLLSNFHGLWTGQGKADTNERIIQSTTIKSFLDARDEEYKILAGDFNLRPDTESMKILEADMRNLIGEYGIQNTRTSMCSRPETPDYVLVSTNIAVKSFRVLADEVSDHAPLCVEI